jgi:transcriptional regulator with XRE-family HTH domain
MLTELRRDKGLTQEALAELLGVPQSYVSKYELGERRLDFVETFEICHALNVDVVAFVQRFAKRIESEGSNRPLRLGRARHGRR